MYLCDYPMSRMIIEVAYGKYLTISDFFQTAHLQAYIVMKVLQYFKSIFMSKTFKIPFKSPFVNGGIMDNIEIRKNRNISLVHFRRNHAEN